MQAAGPAQPTLLRAKYRNGGGAGAVQSHWQRQDKLRVEKKIISRLTSTKAPSMPQGATVGHVF